MSSSTNVGGVDISIGKVKLTVPLCSITGPSSFGGSLTANYSTIGLLDEIRSWNEDLSNATVMGSGWTLTSGDSSGSGSNDQIMRVGDGDSFMWGNQLLVVDQNKID